MKKVSIKQYTIVMEIPAHRVIGEPWDVVVQNCTAKGDHGMYRGIYVDAYVPEEGVYIETSKEIAAFEAETESGSYASKIREYLTGKVEWWD